MYYLVSYQVQGSAPVVYVATSDNLMETIDFAIAESKGSPVLVSQAKFL